MASTSDDRVRDVIHDSDADGFDSSTPKYAGGRPPKSTPPQRQEIERIALAKPGDLGRPFSRWSLPEPAEFLTAERWSTTTDPDDEAKEDRVLESYAIADGHVAAGQGDPAAVSCLDELGPLDVQPRPGRQWAPAAAGRGEQDMTRRRRRATCTRPHGARRLMAAYDLGEDELHGHVEHRKPRTELLALPRYLRSSYPPGVRIALVLDNFLAHLSTKKDTEVGDWAEADDVELAYVPFDASWLTRIEAPSTALHCLTLDGTDHGSHRGQGSMIRRYISWRNRDAADEALC